MGQEVTSQINTLETQVSTLKKKIEVLQGTLDLLSRENKKLKDDLKLEKKRSKKEK